jgi:hypothetical protein
MLGYNPYLLSCKVSVWFPEYYLQIITYSGSFHRAYNSSLLLHTITDEKVSAKQIHMQVTHMVRFVGWQLSQRQSPAPSCEKHRADITVVFDWLQQIVNRSPGSNRMLMSPDVILKWSGSFNKVLVSVERKCNISWQEFQWHWMSLFLTCHFELTNEIQLINVRLSASSR